MQEIKGSKFEEKFTKNWHQIGWTLGATERNDTEDLFLEQIMSNLGNDLIEIKGYALLGIKDLAALTPLKALEIKSKPGRKCKDSGRSNRSQRTYSAAQANNIASFALFCFVLGCFVLFCFVLFCFGLLCFVLFCFALSRFD